ncbi:MAG: Ig-like domain-containing protein, partial [bacterium]|nr:Ig-like domain-containing protein [bacterium]
MAQTHVLAAAFSSNSGQRIGAACEIEGGCGTSTPTPDTSAPSTPTGLTATAVSSSQINLSWTASADNVGVSGYRIYRNGAQIATTAGTSYSNTALTASTAYSYTVSAYDTSGNTSVQSSSASATTQTTSTAPIVGTVTLVDFGATASTNTFGLSGWNTVIKDVYTLYQSAGPGGTMGGVNGGYDFQGVTGTSRTFSAGDQITVTWYNSSATSQTFTPQISMTNAGRFWNTPSSYSMSQVTLSPGATATSQFTFTSSTAGSYSLVNVNVNLDYSTIICDKIVFIPSGTPTTDTVAPTVPAGLTATVVSSSQINLSWTASTDAVGVTGYRIYRSGTQIATSATNSYSNTGLTASTAYSYTVSAYDAVGNVSAQTAGVSGTTLSMSDITPPSVSLSAPITGTTVLGSVTVSASASDNIGVAGVQFKLDGSNLGAEDTTAPYSITWDTAATTNAAHTLTATARDAAGNTTTATGVTVTVSNTVSSSAICEAATGSKCYYVSNKAGSGAGTFADPYGMADLPRSDTPICSLSSPAIEPMMPGDILYFRGGNYSFTTCGTTNYWATGYIRPARSGLAGKPITFKTYPSEAVQVQVGSGTQPAFGTVGLNYIRFQGFTVLGGFGMITGRNNEVSYNEIIGSFVNNVFNHDGIAIGIYGDVTDAPWIHHNIIRGVTGLSENSAGLKFYSTTNAIIEDNYIHDNTSGIHNKHGNQDNTFRRNLVSNNQKAQIMGGSGPDERWRAFIYDNVIDGNGVSSMYVSEGSEIHDNLIRGGTLAGTWQGESAHSNIWNNIVLSKTSSATGYYDSAANFVSSGATAQLNYMNYNLYSVSPSYPFGQYTATPQNFTLLDMKDRGFEQNSSVATSPQIFVDEISYNLQNAWKTSGRYGDAYGPDNIAQIINPNRYGPAALSSGSP